jgi:transcriptional regulator with XRE-family HTH domain
VTRDQSIPFESLTAHFAPERSAKIEQRVERELRNLRRHEIRVAAQMTQVELAERLGLDQSAISRFERRDNPTIASLTEYLSALGATLELIVALPTGERVQLDPADFVAPPTPPFAVRELPTNTYDTTGEQGK